MTIDIEVDAAEVGRVLSERISKALTGAADEAIRYGALGRTIKETAEKTAQALAVQVLADPGFRDEAKAALRRGILRGVEARGEKVARGMNLQTALDLANGGRS